MTRPTQQQFQEALAAAPEAIKEAMFADETTDIISNTAARNNAGNRTLEIASVVGYTLVGLLPMRSFVVSLQTEARLDSETARRIAYDIRREIFAPVAHELAEMQYGI